VHSKNILLKNPYCGYAGTLAASLKGKKFQRKHSDREMAGVLSWNIIMWSEKLKVNEIQFLIKNKF